MSLVVLITFLASCRQRAPEEFSSTQELIDALSAEAVDIAEKDFEVRLDYSTDSIERVEEILSRLHVEYQEADSDEGVVGLASAFGAYIGECIRRAYPDSRWDRDHPVGGEKSYLIRWAGGDSFPLAWCHRRITQGPEDNVWHKFTVLAQGRASQLPGEESANGKPNP
jgi:hypothetical protein